MIHLMTVCCFVLLRNLNFALVVLDYDYDSRAIIAFDEQYRMIDTSYDGSITVYDLC